MATAAVSINLDFLALADALGVTTDVFSLAGTTLNVTGVNQGALDGAVAAADVIKDLKNMICDGLVIIRDAKRAEGILITGKLVRGSNDVLTALNAIRTQVGKSLGPFEFKHGRNQYITMNILADVDAIADPLGDFAEKTFQAERNAFNVADLLSTEAALVAFDAQAEYDTQFNLLP